MTEMLPNIPTAILLLCIAVVVNMQTTPPTACGGGWFGENCRFECHCQGSSTCDRDGNCPNNGKCATGFFGPACQYVDLATEARLGADQDMIDGNDDTCNSDPNAQIVHVSWIMGIAFTWFRLHASNPRNLKNFTVKLNDQLECPNEKKFPVSNRTVDVTCDVHFSVLAVDVVGAVAPDVCSIYISGGRNVALKQATNQSSNMYYAMGPASTAVDGNTDPIFANGHCSHTDGELLPRWSLYFEHPCSVYEIIIHNRISTLDYISGFVLKTYNAGGNLTFSHTERGNFTLTQFVIPLPWHDPLSVISITRPSLDGTASSHLVLCEVQAFGDAVCPDGYYGIACHKPCTCQGSEVCFTVTGACSPGCPIGRFGDNCAFTCNPRCRHLECQQREGTCLSCHEGYTGKFCTKVCNTGTYGPNCTLNCSKNCDGECDRGDGFCHCLHPFVGPTCLECPAPHYGVNCTERCPGSCAYGKCRFDTGQCVSCRGSRRGPYCGECRPRLYGPLCLKVCSRFCDNGTCDVNNGACSPCTDGYAGRNCSEAPPALAWLYMIVAVAVSAFISLVLIWFYIRRFTKGGADDGGSIGSHDSS